MSNSSRNRILVPAVWALSLAAAVLFGYIMAPSPVELTLVDQEPDATGKTTASGDIAPQAHRSSSSPRLRFKSSLSDDSDPMAMAGQMEIATGADVRAALALTDPIRRVAAVADLLSRLDSEGFEDALSSFEGMSFMSERRSERELLLYAWGQLDGDAAMNYVLTAERADTGFGGGRGGRGGGPPGGRNWGQIRDSFSVLGGWAATDADGAVAWVEEHNEGDENPYYIGVINGLASTDLNRASGLVEELPDGRVRGRAIDILVDGYVQQGLYAATDWAQSLPSGELKNDVVGNTARRLASINPVEYADWTLSPVLGDAQDEAVSSFVRQWSRSDPETAADWVSELADDELRSDALAQVAENWGRSDPEAAAEWLSQFEAGPETDQMIVGYVDAVDRRDPETAITWALAISDVQVKNETVQEVTDQWLRRDPEGAAAFMGIEVPEGSARPQGRGQGGRR